ncbi:ABC transporter ATP-binding protein [Micromonospora rubida]|uniref:ABC transporter ATP-binding protein n=1 Tax=Micromonospora rubida TaxID=2697657 RepID=A0ABW7SV58_9ACTN
MLRIGELTVGYEPDAPVLHTVSMALPPNGVHAIVGPNGAGKTTLLHTIAGHLRPTTGYVMLDGHDITGIRTVRAARAGIALAPQGRRLWSSLTVRDHLTMTRPGAATAQEQGCGWGVDDLLEVFPALAARLHHRADQLSGGEQQMLTLARALRLAPRLLLCDEPTEGLAPTVADRIRAVLTDLPRHGVTVLVTLPQTRAATGLAHTVHVLTAGRLSDPVDPTTEHTEDLIRRHLGLTTDTEPPPRTERTTVRACHRPPTHGWHPPSQTPTPIVTRKGDQS